MVTTSEELKQAAVAAFRDNSKLSAISGADREITAAFYEWVAGDTRRIYADLARLYNLERAKFLRRQEAWLMFKFQEGDVVSILKGIPELDLSAGDRGVMWALYDTDPPAYEATFWPANGDGFDMTVYEHEIMATGLMRPVFERPVFDPEVAAAAA